MTASWAKPPEQRLDFMTDITPLVAAGRQVIESYAPGGFRISGRVYRSGVIVMPSRVVPWTAGGDPSRWTPGDFSGLMPLRSEIEVLLLGSGIRAGILPPDVRGFFKMQGLACDVMDTGAACRTYNVLMAEDRKVAALLLPAAGALSESL